VTTGVPEIVEGLASLRTFELLAAIDRASAALRGRTLTPGDREAIGKALAARVRHSSYDVLQALANALAHAPYSVARKALDALARRGNAVVRESVERARSLHRARSHIDMLDGPEGDFLQRWIREINGSEEVREKAFLAASRHTEYLVNKADHELRRLVNRISFELGVLRESVGDASEFRPQVDLLLSFVAPVERTLNDFREFTKVVQPRFAPVELRRPIETAIALVQPAAKLRVDVDADLMVMADEALVVIALRNVIQNAVNAMTDTASPQLRIAATQDRDGWVEITVADNGRGMPDPGAPIRPFSKGPESKGSGLGLSNVQRIVEQQHHGHLRFTPRATRGTTAHLHFPPNPYEEIHAHDSDRRGR